MKNSFNSKIGEEYDLFSKACPHFHILQRKLADLINDYSSDRSGTIQILEIGCGTGITTEFILQATPKIHVTAIDNESVMLDQAKLKLQEALKMKSVNLVLADALEFLESTPSEAFDGFVSAFTLHNFSSDYRSKVLKEIFRVLKKRGLFLNADKYSLDDPIAHQESLDWQLDQFQKTFSTLGRADLIEEWTNHYHQDNEEEFLMRELDAIQEMKGLGFSNIEVLYREKMEALLRAYK